MRVLIACEFSGAVRDAFAALGHDAMSCDLLPTEAPGPHHQGDVLQFLNDNPDRFDLMVAHPPCTYLTLAGVRWLYGGKGDVRDPARWAKMEDGARFFRALLDAPVPHIAVENPIMHGHGQSLVGRGPDQVVQPWMFGHGETKATCFWLRNLPPLRPTNIVEGREHRVHSLPPGPDRWKLRSETLPGIAAAMAEQWGVESGVQVGLGL